MTYTLHTFRGLGSALRLLREAAGLKRAQVAERTGVSQRRISRYEREENLPDLPTLERLLVCYGVDAEGLSRALKEVREERPA